MKKSAKLPTVLLLLGALFVLNNCSRKVSEQSATGITPPFEKLNVAYSENTIDAVSGGEIKFDNGTKISIPQSAFVDAKGKAVTSKVKVSYREFHNSSQILMSGIPMKYKGANFQTAGMFEIKGNTENGDLVHLANDKEISVQMASYIQGNDYEFYYFDEGKNEWILKGKSAAIENTDKKGKLAARQDIVPPLKPQRQASSFVFDLDVNTQKYPELKDFKGVVWQYAGNGEWNPEKSPWVFNEKWSFIELNKINNEEARYSLSLKSRSKEFTTVVTPVLNGKYYKNALAKFEKKMTEYRVAMEVRKQEDERLAGEADMLRTFSINNFGIYNWDCFYKQQENVMRINAEFRLDKEIPGVRMDNINVYLLTGNQRAVITYDPYSRQSFSFNTTDINKLVAVLPGNRLAVFGNQDFKTILSSTHLKQNDKYTFTLKVIEKQVVTTENLNSVLAAI